MARASAALRILTGLVWLSNALAKVLDVGNYDWGFFSFDLITLGSRVAGIDRRLAPRSGHRWPF